MLLGLLAKGVVLGSTLVGAIVGGRAISVALKTKRTPPPSHQLDSSSGNSRNNHLSSGLEENSSLTPNSTQEHRDSGQPSTHPVTRSETPKTKPSEKKTKEPKQKQVKAPKEPKPAKVKQPKERSPKTPKNTQKIIQPEPQTLIQPRSLEEVSKEATQALNKLKDYTFKLSSPCSQGTAWILDYQLTDSDDKYPTTFYFATTTDVVNKWIFASNEYGEKLPVTINEYKIRKGRDFRGDKDNITKNLLNDPLGCVNQEQYGLFDISITQAETSDKLEGLISSKKIKRPKLFYSGVDFWKDKDNKYGVPRSNYKDFVVIEVEFNKAEYAQEITKGFANTYKGTNNFINVFGDSLDISKVDSNSENYYSLGYLESKVGQKTRRVSNWTEKDMTSSVLATEYPNLWVGYKGYVPQNRILTFKAGLQWGGESNRYWEFGHFQILKGNALGKGSSGSMGIDKTGNVLGIRNGQENEDYSLFTPLRSNEIDLGGIKTPKYDLILGAVGQKSSYREKVEQHIIGKKKGTTWLSTFEAWKNAKKGPLTTVV